MRGLKYKIITVLAVFVMPFCAEVSGQSFNTLNPGMGDFNDMNFQTPGGIGANPFQTEEGPLDSARMDTTKKERKPLESYFFNDSIRSQNNFAWNINMSMNRIEMTRIDTILYDFQVDYPFLKKDVGDAYLGNLGAPPSRWGSTTVRSSGISRWPSRSTPIFTLRRAPRSTM